MSFRRSPGVNVGRWPAPPPSRTACVAPVFSAPAPPCDELEPLPKELGALPAVLQAAIRDGMLMALAATPPITTQPSPTVAPPFRSQPIPLSGTVVVTGLTAEAEDGGDMLATAAQGAAAAEAAPTVFDSTPTDPWMVIARYTPPAFHRGVIDRIDVVPSSVDAYQYLRFSVVIGNQPVLDDVTILKLREGGLGIQVPQQQEVLLRCRNLDTFSAFVLHFGVQGWVYPVADVGDSLSTSVQHDSEFRVPTLPCEPCR